MATEPGANLPPAGAATIPMDADVIVIGAGPAGMSAAIELGAAGFRVITLDMNPSPGGQIYRAIESNLGDRSADPVLARALGKTYAAGKPLVARFRNQNGIDYQPDTTVWEVRTDGTVGWQRAGRGGYMRARHVVLANGAMERPMPFPGWTLPGVMTAGAIQTLLKSSRLKPTGRVVLAGTGPLLLLLALQLLKLGVKPALIARTDRLGDKVKAMTRLRPAALPAMAKGAGWLMNLRRANLRTITGVTRLEALGDDRVREVAVETADATTRLPCDTLIVHDGIIPSIDLVQGAGLAVEWCAGDTSWRPVTSQSGLSSLSSGPNLSDGPTRIWITGDARQIGGGDAAAAHGRHVGQTLAARLGAEDTEALTAGPARIYARAMAPRAFIDAAFPQGRISVELADSTIVCRCEEITAGSIRSAARQGATDPDQLRGLLRCGMGSCQGRSCASTIARLLSEEIGLSRPPRPFRGRPPVRPVPLGVLATLESLDPELVSSEALNDKPDASGGSDADV